MNDDDTSDQTAHQSPDDALAPKDDSLFRPTKDEPRLSGDYDPPAAPASDTGSKPLPADDPESDVEPDAHEKYDEGESDAEVDNRSEGPDKNPKPLE